MEGILDLLVPAGLAGLEVVHPLHSRTQIREFTEQAARWDLVATGGSDYHGDREDEMLPGSFDLGLEIVEELEARTDRVKSGGRGGASRPSVSQEEG
jgi:hypothetical protein